MNISAMNCTPIKPQVASFKGDKFSDEDFDALIEMTDKINDEYVQSSTIKKPLAIVGSVALAAVAAFTFGTKIVAFVNKIVPSLTDPNNKMYFEKFIKNGANKAKNIATDLQSGTGKAPKFKKAVGSVLETVIEGAKNIYKKITTIGTSKLTDDVTIAQKKLENLGGVAAAATFVPAAVSSDSDEDCVSDMCQKGVNAYTGTKSQINKAVEGANVLGDLVEALT